MIRKLMASSAMLALMTAGAFSVAQAQTEPAEQTPPAAIEEQAPAADATTEAAAATESGTLVPEQPTIATAFIGQNVYSSEDPESDNIGEVKDLVISDDGTITEAIVGVGGFLGIGEKNVAVPFDELQVFERDGEIRLVYAATREQLEAAPEVEWTAYDPSARFAEEQAAMQPEAPAGGMDSTGGIAPVPAPAPAPEVAAEPDSGAATEEETASADGVTPEEESEAAGKNEAFAGDPAAEEPSAEQDVAATEAPSEEQPADTSAEAPADELTAAADAAAPAEDQPADQQMAETDATAPAEEQTAQTDATAPAEEPQADEQMAQTDQPASGEEAAFLSYSADQMRASTLMGKEVFGPDDESIGEVSDLVLQQDGETRAALIDVGGFLGVGEKEVAIPFDQFEIAPAAEEGGEPRLTVAMSREELEQLPAFEDRTMGSEDVAATGEGTADTAEPAQEEATADTSQPAAEEEVTAESTEQPVETTEPAAEEPALAETEQPDTTADQELVAEGEAAPADGVVAEDTQLSAQDLSAEDLIGTAVYGADDQTIGEVGDVIFAESGNIEAVVVDVGGFLGIGEKPVAVQFDALNVQKDTNGDTTLWLNATQEQLENAPAYDETAAAQ